MTEIRVAIAGVGNCASSLVQGVYYYKNVKENDSQTPGLMHNVFGGYKISDIMFVAAFDVDKRKVGQDLSKAIFSPPNCTKVFCADIPKQNIVVQKGPVLDGIADHMKDYPPERTFLIDEKQKPVDVAAELKKAKAQVLVNYVPVGSEQAAKYYAQAALDAGCAFVNCMPVFIASDNEWAENFEEKGLPIAGDDVASQLGATITHKALTKLFTDRGIKIDRMYQLNTGGNADFLNMLERSRLKSKKISKTEAVQAMLGVRLDPDNIHIGPSDYVPWQKDNKICFIRIEGRMFGDVPLELDLKLSVEDSPNSAGCIIDVIRCCKIALDRKISGPLISISAFTMKHPPIHYSPSAAKEMVEEFIKGARER